MLRFPLLSCSRFEARKFSLFFAGLTLFSAGLVGCGSGNPSFGNVPLTITAVTPATGPVTGGNTVKIVGTGFQATTAVWIWSNQAHVVKLVSSTELDVAAPAVSAPRTADVMVSASQSQFFRLDGSYTYVGSTPPTPPTPPPPARAATRIVWSPASATVAVGAPIGTAQLNATAVTGQLTPVSGTFAYSPAAGTAFSAAGAQTLSVSFTPADATSFLGSTGTTVIHVVTEAVGTTTNVTSPADNPIYGQPVSFNANVTSSKGTPQGTVTFLDGQTSLGAGTLSGGVASISTAALSAGGHNITAAYSGDSLHTGSTGSVKKSIGPAQVQVTWNPTPATIKVGAPLGAGQLDAIAATKRLATVSGTFIYSPAAGTTFKTPGPQTLSVTFTPKNSNYIPTSAQTVINVTSNVVDTGTTIASSAPNSAYGQPVTFTATVSAGNGNATGSVAFLDGQTPLGSGVVSNGSATFSTAALTTGVHNISAAYSGDANNTASNGSTVQNVTKAQAAISWFPNPATVIVGTALGAGQLDANASSKFINSVPGSFAYTPAAGTTFNTTGPQILSVIFTPVDSVNFVGATATAQINVESTTNKSTTAVSSATPNSIYGQTVTFTANVTAGSGTPTGSVLFSDGQTALGSAALNNGAAMFATSALTAGAHSITAMYSGDSVNGSSNASTTQNVSKAAVTIAWSPSPSTISVGAALGAGQLDAVASTRNAASVAGTLVYSPAAGTSFSSPGSQTLNVTFTPNDAVNFSGATGSATITVASTTSPTTTTVTSSAPTSSYGQTVVLTAAVTSGTGTPTGSVSFTDGATVLGTGALANGAATISTSVLTTGAHTITAAYGGDSTHTGSSASATQNVSQAQVTIAWTPKPSSISVGAALGAGQLDAIASTRNAASVAGTLVYSPAAGTSFSSPGSQTLSVTFTPNDAADFSGATGSATITVASTTSPTTTTVTSSAPTSSYGQAVVLTAAVTSGTGTPTGSVSFTDGATVLGTGTLANGVATISTSALVVGAHAITAAYGGDSTHTGSSASATQNVSKAAVTIAWSPSPSTINVGAALGAGQLDAVASTRNAASVAGTLMYSPAAGTSFSSPGSQTLNVTFTPNDAVNFSGATGSAIIKIISTIAQSTTAVASSAPNSSPGQSVTFTATVTSGGGTPTGSVSFMDSAALLGTGTLSGGTATFTTTSLNSGKHNISAVYAGDANTAGSTGSLTQNVSAGAGNYVFVDARSGSDSNSGSQSAPYRTIGAAVSKALSNNVKGISTSVQIGPGVYREYVNIYPTGGQTSAQMTFEAVTPGTAIIAGSDVVSNWQAVNSTEYVHSWSNSLPGCGIPSQWPNLPRIILDNQMVFVDGNPMTQILSPADQQPGTFYEDSSQIHIWPPAGTDMSAATVEVSARSETLQINSRSNIVLRGLVFEHAGSCINSSGTNVFSSNNILLDQVQSNWNNWGGIQVSFGDSVTVQNSAAYHNGGVGVGAWRNTNITLQNVETDYNNWRGAMASFYDFGMGGTKMMLTHGAHVLNLRSYRNQGQGLWFDTDNENISVDSAAVSENMIADLKLEANQGPFTVTNSSFCSSGAGILISNTERLTATGNNFYNNGGSTSTIWEASVFLGGTPGGRSFTNWQTGAAMLTFATYTTLSNNTYVDGGTGQNVFGTFSSGTFWNNFVSTLHSNQNTFYDGNTKTPFLDPAGHRDDLNGWQNATGQDSSSTWAQASNAAKNCTPPPPSYPDFNVEANNRENAPQNVGVAPYYMSGGSVSIPIQVRSFNGGSVTLSMSALPSGVSASFSPATLTAGNTVLTLRASGGAATETIPITVIATSGNRVHTMTVLAGIAP